MTARISKEEVQTLIKEVEALDNEELDDNIELTENQIKNSTTQQGIDNARTRLAVLNQEYDLRIMK